MHGQVRSYFLQILFSIEIKRRKIPNKTKPKRKIFQWSTDCQIYLDNEVEALMQDTALSLGTE